MGSLKFNWVSIYFQDLIISNSEDKSIRVWDMSKRTCLHTFRYIRLIAPILELDLNCNFVLGASMTAFGSWRLTHLLTSLLPVTTLEWLFLSWNVNVQLLQSTATSCTMCETDTWENWISQPRRTNQCCNLKEGLDRQCTACLIIQLKIRFFWQRGIQNWRKMVNHLKDLQFSIFFNLKDVQSGEQLLRLVQSS